MVSGSDRLSLPVPAARNRATGRGRTAERLVRDHAADLAALLALVALLAAGTWRLVAGGLVSGLDTLNFFYPMFSFLGERLRAGDLPGWNPSQFAGSPFAADPESGWMYLPAMAFFSLLPLATAAASLMLFHIALAAGGTYALARLLGIGPLGALTAATAFSLSGFFVRSATSWPAYVFVTTWIPLILIGIHRATAARSWPARLAWWGLAGIAVSQVLAIWLGQGSYYVLLVAGSYAAYRTLIEVDAGSLRLRVGRLALHGGAVLLLGGGLAAAAILPRLAFVGRSNLADGYHGWAAGHGGLTPPEALLALMIPSYFTAGAATVLIALSAVWRSRARFAVPYWAGLCAAALVLTWPRETPLHSGFYLLPRFQGLHEHSPHRILVVAFLGVALLAGAAIHLVRRPHLRFALVALILVDVVVGGTVALNRTTTGLGAVGKVDLTAYYRPSGAAAFLAARTGDEPARYFGYDPSLAVDWYGNGQPVRYRLQMFDPAATALLVNNRATLLGLHDLQGYNPLQLGRYAELVTAMNGQPQDYHGTDVLPAGLASPILDLLNARYIVIPAVSPPDRPDLDGLVRDHPVVYRDEQVRVLENRAALPRAWVVHEARQVVPGAALDLLATGAVDPRRTALLEAAPPPLAPVADPARSTAAITGYEPDAIRVSTTTDAAGLLVLGEPYDPDWRAYVDGAPAPLLVANHALRAVAVPAGEHTVELRYESPALRLGLAITLATAAGLGLLLTTAAVRSRRARRTAA